MEKSLLLIISFFTSTLFAQTHTELIVKNRIDHLTTLAREPMVCEHPSGTLFVTGYRNASHSPQLWKSSDAGKTWRSVNVGTPAEGAIGNSDADLFIDAEGNLYLLSMSYTKLPEELEGFDFSSMKGERITVGVSKDEGKSWQWHTLSENEYDDRPWISASTDGTLHVIWNDGKGVHHTLSKDQGATWQKQALISEKGGSSFLAHGDHGQLAVRVSPVSASGFQMDAGVDLIRLSLDNGATWQDISIPGDRDWEQSFGTDPRWVEPLVWDKEDKLYALWCEGSKLKLAITPDNGTTWQEHLLLQATDTLYFPYLELSEKGLLCTWISGFGAEIRHHAALISLEADSLQMYALEPLKLDLWSRFSNEGYQRATGGEYYPIIPLANGNFGMVTTIQNSKAGREGFTWWELVLNTF